MIPLDDVAGSEPDGVELELHRGDQPHYWWLLAAQWPIRCSPRSSRHTAASSAGAPRPIARARSGGLLLHQGPSTRFADYEITVGVGNELAVLDPFPEPGSRGVFDHGAVRIER